MATPTTLPSSFTAGAVLTAAQMNDLRGAFRVLQVVQGTTSTQMSNSTSTYADTGLTATITPSSTSSKIMVITSQDVGKDNGNSENAVQMALLRGASVITNSGNVLCYTNSVLFNIITHTFSYLDSPATLAATTYKTQIRNVNNSASVKAQYGGGTATITLMEISA
jgi:hypothetical protein